MKRTGVFFHPIFSQIPGPVVGLKFASFPGIIEGLLKLDNVVLYQPEPAPDDLLFKVHTRVMIEDLKGRSYGRSALTTVGGCIQASELAWKGEIDNALVFNIGAGHHAGPAYAWGGTYASCTGPAIANLRQKFPTRRFAILDTDSHHGDGCREIFQDDPDVLHVCFCSRNRHDKANNVDVDVGWSIDDDGYLSLVEKEFVSRAIEFKPEMIFHFFGHDICRGDYGSLGLSEPFFVDLAELVKGCADKVCAGRYVIITGGGARRDVAEYILPEIIKILAEQTSEVTHLQVYKPPKR